MVLRGRLARRRPEQLFDRGVDDQRCPRRNPVLAADICLAVDGDDAPAERLFGFADAVPGDPGAIGGAVGEPGQGAGAVGKLQPAKARRIERGGGIGRRRIPRQRKHRAVRQVLLDLGGESAVELTQQRRLQVELVVARQCQDRDRVLDPGRREPVAAFRPAGDKHRAGGLDRGGEFRVGRPQDDDAMAGNEGDVARGAERQRVAADDDHRDVVRRRHRPRAQTSALSPAGGG